MTEEFLTDIIAANDADGGDATDTNATAADDTPAADATTESSSTADAAEHKNAEDVSKSEGSDVAPTDPSEVEELASQLGWNKDHKGAEAVDASTYILRSKDIQKTMKDHNKDLKNQLTGLNGSIDALKDHNERVFKADVKKLEGELTKLKADKKAAVELADVAKVEELDQQIEDVQKDIDAPVPKVSSNNPVFDAWVEDNGWYLTDPEMAQYADTLADQYAGAPADRIYAAVRNKVAELFPDKFEDAKAVETVKTVTPAEAEKDVKKVVAPKSPVESGGRSVDTAGFSKADLSADQVAIMNQFVKGGIMTEDQYVADIAKLQGA